MFYVSVGRSIGCPEDKCVCARGYIECVALSIIKQPAHTPSYDDLENLMWKSQSTHEKSTQSEIKLAQRLTITGTVNKDSCARTTNTTIKSNNNKKKKERKKASKKET